MQVKIPHNFSRAQATLRVKRALEEARPKMAGQAELHEERWEENVLHFDVTAQGQRISGTLTVEDSTFDLYAKLPLMLRMFEGQIEQMIQEQAQKMLG